MPNRHLLLLACCTALLAACGASDAPPAAPDAERAPAEAASTRIAASGVIDTASGRYTFTPRVCAIHKEDGVDDIEISGPGTSPDGAKVFVDFSSTANELSIALGVDTPFSSPDRQLKAGQYVTEPMDIRVDGRTIHVANLTLRDGDDHLLPGSLRIDCG